mgnify:CR=1 FL=1
MNKKLIIIIASVIILICGGIGVYAVTNNNKSNDQTQSTVTQKNKATWDNNILTLKAEESKNALELLQQNATIVTKGTGANAYVTSVNGVTTDATKNEYWEFDVNGAMATLGVGSYVTKPDDILTLKISSF